MNARASGGAERQPFDPQRAARSLHRLSPPRALTRPPNSTARSPFADDGRTRFGSRVLEHRIVQRTTFGWTLALQEEVERVGHQSYLDRQLAPETVDDFGLEALIAEAFPTTRQSALELAIAYNRDPTQPVVELVAARIVRALYSPRQLLERVVDLWTDHFNIDLADGLGPFLKPVDDRTVIRRHALGRFRDLLGASASSPAMLAYLTNDSNVKGHPNENYARELMELHTLGEGGGYTEEDVKEVARCFTGWTFGTGENGAEFGRHTFVARDHDNDRKSVLGTEIPAGGGREDVARVLDILSRHPSTARFIAEKILHTFWGEEPPARIVKRVAERFATSGGDVEACLREALSWHLLVEAPLKLKRPLHYLTSAVRGTFAELTDFNVFFSSLDALGHVPFFWHPPNGYPDTEGYWSGLLLPRLDFAALAFAELEPVLTPDPSVFAESASITARTRWADTLLLFGGMTAGTRTTIERHAAATPSRRLAARETLALTLASPEFQYY